MFIQISFYFHPYLEKIPILTNIFQMGRNHQLVSPGEFAQSFLHTLSWESKGAPAMPPPQEISPY